nr:MAG TPA: peptidase [Bacteriophage sp.]
MKLVLPVDNYPITLPFGAIYDDDIRGSNWNYSGKRHNGVDFGCPVGTQVKASADGRVSFCGFDKTGYGYLIKISHTDGSESRYAHLSRLLASINAYVYAEQPIALSGDSGNVTGAHLHWEYRTADKKAVDPMEYVDKSSENVNENTKSVIKVGDRVVIAASLVNIRDAAGGDLLGQLHHGAAAEILTDVEVANGLRWRKVRSEFWVAEVDAEGTPLLTSV